MPEMEFIRLKLVDELGNRSFDLQYGGIPILQNLSLRIDQRLIVLGFFLEQADDLLREGKFHQWAELSYLFENYLVNEFFLNLYPFRIHGSCALNYKVFLLTYKLAEFVLTAMASVKERQISELDIVRFFSDFSNRMDHNGRYMDECVSATSKQSEGLGDLMKALLDVEG